MPTGNFLENVYITTTEGTDITGGFEQLTTLTDTEFEPLWIEPSYAESITVKCDPDDVARIVDARPEITDVIFNDPATIVFWSDGTKTVVKAQNEPYDAEKGLAMAISKKYFYNKGNYNNVFKNWVTEEPEYVTGVDAITSLIERLKVRHGVKNDEL